MIKRFIILVSVMVLCLAVANEALAATVCKHEQLEWQATGTKSMRSIDSRYHQLHILYDAYCTICGDYVKSYFVPDQAAKKLTHVDSGIYQGSHIEGESKHEFYRTCAVCGAEYGRVVLACPGNGIHVVCPF